MELLVKEAWIVVNPDLSMIVMERLDYPNTYNGIAVTYECILTAEIFFVIYDHWLQMYFHEFSDNVVKVHWICGDFQGITRLFRGSWGLLKSLNCKQRCTLYVTSLSSNGLSKSRQNSLHCVLNDIVHTDCNVEVTRKE